MRFSKSYVPYPVALRKAINSGLVHVSESQQGVAYMISPNCQNVSEIRAAIAQRTNWERIAARIEGVLMVVGLVAVMAAMLSTPLRTWFLTLFM